jgi:hypothetical protein
VAISSCDKHRSQQSNPTQRARHSQASSSTEAWKLVKSCPVAKSSSLQLQLQLQEEETEPTAQPKLVAVRPVPQEMTLSSSHTAHFGRSLSGSRRGSLLFSFPLRCDKPNGDTADPQSGRNGRLNSHHEPRAPILCPGDTSKWEITLPACPETCDRFASLGETGEEISSLARPPPVTTRLRRFYAHPPVSRVAR